MIKFLKICAILGISGCCTVPQPRTIGLPFCERPTVISAEIWNDLNLMRNTMERNQRVDAECISLLRNRITTFDRN